MLSPQVRNFQNPHGLYPAFHRPYMLMRFLPQIPGYQLPEILKHQYTLLLLESVSLSEVNIQLFFTCFATSLKQATPRSKLGKTTEPYFWYSGTGRIFIVTSVTTPRVPLGEKKN